MFRRRSELSKWYELWYYLRRRRRGGGASTPASALLDESGAPWTFESTDDYILWE